MSNRISWITYYNQLAKDAEIPTVIWDNDSLTNPDTSGEAHGYIDRETAVWHEVQEPVIDALIQAWRAEIKGDLNGDERFTIADLVMLQKLYLCQFARLILTFVPLSALLVFKCQPISNFNIVDYLPFCFETE